MGWGRRRWRRDWPEYPPRPKAAKLSPEKRDKILCALAKERDRSPVLVALGVEVMARRGRFYLERPDDEEPDHPIQVGRLTPLTKQRTALLLEVEYRSWKEIERGGCSKVMQAVAGDERGRFHGLGALDAALRERGTDRLKLTKKGRGFTYADGTRATAQEVLYHRFGITVPVIAEPSGWYALHRRPVIVQQDARRGRVLVEFSAEDWGRGRSFGGRCLYARRSGDWGAYTVRPNASESIADAEAWLQKRDWEEW